MFLKKPLNIALLISTLLHATIFLPLPHFKNFFINKKVASSLKITYLVSRKTSPSKIRLREEPNATVKQKENKSERYTKPRATRSIELEHKPPKKVVSISKSFLQNSDKQSLKIEIPPELPKEKEALYLDYYQSIREKIRRYIINNYPRYIACGEICLHFVLLPNGNLKDIEVLEQRSSQNRQLKEIAKRSIQQASPFLPFPKKLSQAQLSFNVVISFELEN